MALKLIPVRDDGWYYLRMLAQMVAMKLVVGLTAEGGLGETQRVWDCPAPIVLNFIAEQWIKSQFMESKSLAK